MPIDEVSKSHSERAVAVHIRRKRRSTTTPSSKMTSNGRRCREKVEKAQKLILPLSKMNNFRNVSFRFEWSPIKTHTSVSEKWKKEVRIREWIRKSMLDEYIGSQMDPVGSSSHPTNNKPHCFSNIKQITKNSKTRSPLVRLRQTGQTGNKSLVSLGESGRSVGSFFRVFAPSV